MKTKLRTLCFLFAFVVTFSMYNVWKSLQVLEESPLAWQLDWQKTGQSTTAKAKKGFKQAESSIEKDLSTSAKESQDDRLAQSRFRRKNAPKKKSNTISALKSLGAEDAREQPKTTVEKQPEDSGSDGIPDYAKAWSNITTFAFYEARLRSGYRNQMMAFTVLIMECLRQGHGQFLMETVSQKDTYGSNKPINFWELWDIEHWNSFYPALPRLVRFDPDLHDQYDVETSRWYRTDEGNWTDRMQSKYYNKPTRPIPYGKQHLLMTAYIRYSQGAGVYTTSDGHRNPAELLMLRQAMRPHPDLQKIIDSLLQSLLPGGHNSTIEYMTLHARVEPDMQKHPVCIDKKVVNLTHIFEFMESKWPEPPASRIFMPINRQALEKEGHPEVVKQIWRDGKAEKTNWMAVDNLAALNKAADQGLWNGKAKVFEFGANALANTKFSDRPSTTGAMLNFFIGVNAKIFIGTEVSSYSHDLLATRFYRGMMGNHKYLPEGLVDWTPPGTNDSPGFGC